MAELDSVRLRAYFGPGTGRHRAPKERKGRKAAASTVLAAGLVGGIPALQSGAHAQAGGSGSAGSSATTERTEDASVQRSSAGTTSYTVRSGDTLAKIADRHGMSWRALYQSNRSVIEDPNLIYPGEVLQVRGSGGSAPTTRTVSAEGVSGYAAKLLAVAASLEGTPYRWGGESPRTGFDCSGFTQYVFDKVGIDLPRTSSQQRAATDRISSSQARPGDLVFFHNSGGVYHVAIYAGDGMIWQSPRPGRSVELADIWTSSISFGRA